MSENCAAAYMSKKLFWIERTSWKMEPSKMDFRALETGRTEYFFYDIRNCL